MDDGRDRKIAVIATGTALDVRLRNLADQPAPEIESAHPDDTAALNPVEALKAALEPDDPKDNPDYYKRAYITPHPKLTETYCGHRLDTARTPNTNCAGCWDFFFVKNQGFVQALANVLLVGTPEQIALIPRTHGSKMFKHLKRFVARVKEIQEATAQQVQEPVLKADYEFKTYAEVEAEALATGQEVSVA